MFLLLYLLPFPQLEGLEVRVVHKEMLRTQHKKNLTAMSWWCFFVELRSREELKKKGRQETTKTGIIIENCVPMETPGEAQPPAPPTALPLKGRTQSAGVSATSGRILELIHLNALSPNVKNKPF